MGSLSLATSSVTVPMNPPPGFTELYNQYSAIVYKSALRVTGNPADAEDALQTVFMRVWNRSDGVDPQGHPDRYFRRAATNAAIDILRSKASKAEAPLETSGPKAVRESTYLLKETLRQAVAALPKDDAEMFLLRYVEGLSNGEIAEIFGVEKARVAVKLHRIRQVLQAELGK